MLATKTKAKITTAFTDPNTIGTCLLALMLDSYGTEFLNWEFDTVRMELQDDWDVQLPDSNADKLQALMTALTTDQFFRDPFAFGHICTALNGNEVDFDSVEETAPDAMAWGVFEVASLLGKDTPGFNAEVQRYIGTNLGYAGIHRPPKVLKDIADYPDQTGEAALQQVDDDPIMYHAAFEHAQSGAQDVDSYVGQRFKLMMQQLSVLHLENRDNPRWLKLLEQLRSRGQI